MPGIKRLVLDVLKPHEPGIIDVTDSLSNLKSISSVNATLYEVDEQVENVKLTIVGTKIDYKEVEDQIKKMGGTVHSVDEVVAGDEIIEEVRTPQDG